MSAGCNAIPDKSWIQSIPQKAPFVIIPTEDATLNNITESPYIPFLEDISSSAISMVSQVDSSASEQVPLKGVILYPGVDDRLEPVWVSSATPGLVEKLQDVYYEKFAQNQYYFKGIKIHKLHIQQRNLYVARLHSLLLLSESSLGVEDAIRTYLGDAPSANMPSGEMNPGTLVVNTPSIDHWVTQLAKIIYRPAIKNAFSGTKPAMLNVHYIEEEETSSRVFEGTIPLGDEQRGELVAAVSQENSPIELDRYISSNAAGFGIFRLSPRLVPPASVPDTSRLDSLFLADTPRYASIANILAPEFALVMYAESGFLSTGEHLFLRKTSNASRLREYLNQLVRDRLIQRREGLYYVQSLILSKLIGSDLSTFSDFYLDITGNVVVISKRKGLAEVVQADHRRRRVIFYEDTYRDIKSDFPDEVSSLFIANPDFFTFLQPFLAPNHYADAIFSRFDLLALSTTFDQENREVAFKLRAVKTTQTSEPFQEKWLFPTRGAQLSGTPVMADIGGSAREEIIFATENGSIYALAADGTVIMQANTGSDRPVGPATVYDWYGTNENVILIAAGNKVYGWNDTGTLLPQFPFTLDEQITSPVMVKDIDRNGLPEAVVATADRRLHALDGRGSNINGWPLTTNATIQQPPLVDYFQGAYSVIAFSENTIHAWYPDGEIRQGFPKFVNASLNGSPVLHRNHILGGADDGNLYAIGRQQLFADSLNAFSVTSDTSQIEAISVSNSALIGKPSVYNLSVLSDSLTYSGTMILTMSSNGSLFLFSEEGPLRFTRSMGQPGAPGFSPFIEDINRDGSKELIGLGNFGRIYAWNLSNGERLYDLPTTGMKHPVIFDIDGDGYKELIAQTSEGVRCWTIFGTE